MLNERLLIIPSYKDSIYISRIQILQSLLLISNVKQHLQYGRSKHHTLFINKM